MINNLFGVVGDKIYELFFHYLSSVRNHCMLGIGVSLFTFLVILFIFTYVLFDLKMIGILFGTVINAIYELLFHYPSSARNHCM